MSLRLSWLEHGLVLGCTGTDGFCPCDQRLASIFKPSEGTFALVRVGSSTHCHASCHMLSDWNLEEHLSFWQQLWVWQPQRFFWGPCCVRVQIKVQKHFWEELLFLRGLSCVKLTCGRDWKLSTALGVWFFWSTVLSHDLFFTHSLVTAWGLFGYSGFYWQQQSLTLQQILKSLWRNKGMAKPLISRFRFFDLFLKQSYQLAAVQSKRLRVGLMCFPFCF